MPVCNHVHRLHAVMAGVGDPYSVLTPERLLLVRRLADGRPTSEIAATLGLSETQLLAELQPLLAASLVKLRAGRFQPTFLCVPEADVARVDADARELGRLFAARLRARWPALERGWQRLALSRALPFSTAAFLFVGDRVLDVGLLDALARDGALLAPAPARPSPTARAARYYFWMIEGEHDQLGCYGQRATPLPWPGSTLLTFGRYQLNDARRHARDDLERHAMALLAAGVATPAALARELHVPLASLEDARAWSDIGHDCATELASAYRDREPHLRALHATLHAGQRLPDSFAEFICWHDHLAYAHAIDNLVGDGCMAMPPEAFAAALWHEESDGDF